MKEPVAKKIRTEFNNFGKPRVDNYHWMKERDAQDVLDYIKEENDYTEHKMSSTKSLQEQLVKEFKATELNRNVSAKFLNHYDNYYYYHVTQKDWEYHKEYRVYNSPESKPELIIDVNRLAEGHKYYDLGSWDISDDNKYLVYSYDNVSRRKYKIVIQDRETGEYLPDEIENTTGKFVLLPDNFPDKRTIYYVLEEETTLRPYRVMRHTIGTPVSDDVLVYEESDEEYNVGVGFNRGLGRVHIHSRCKVNNEIRYLSIDDIDAEPKIILPREGEHEYSYDMLGEYYYIYTNHEAKNFRLVKVHQSTYQDKSTWVDIVPHDKDVSLDSYTIKNDFIAISQTENFLTKIKILKNDVVVDELNFEGDAYVANLYGGGSYKNVDTIRYSYESMNTPDSLYEYNVNTKESVLIKRYEVPGGFDSRDYTTKRVYVKVRDGVKVPVTYMYKNTTKLKDAPMYLTGYGSYGYSYTPTFSRLKLNLVDRGIVYAIAHIRGGSEMGEQWYDDGKMLKKKNTFNDFIDCAKYFIDQEITSSDKLIVNGGSAGGLLMGVVVNEAPELFKGVIADVPFVDVINTMLDETIPLTVGEYKEWGNPNEEEYYNYILSYSPYDNVKKQEYPNMLIYSGYHDSQVQYWEPLKWVAKIREMRTNPDNTIILKMNMDTGHGYASTKSGYYEELAFKYAFILDTLGL